MIKKVILIVIVLALTGIFYYFYNQNSSALNLAARHIENVSLEYYNNRAMTQKKSDEQSKLRDEINQADLQFLKNPKLTAVSYESLLKKDPGNNSIQLRLGMIYLKLKQYDAAKEHFYFVHENKDSGLQPDAAWFLGLISLIEDDKISAKTLLQESLRKKSFYKKEAAELLEFL